MTSEAEEELAEFLAKSDEFLKAYKGVYADDTFKQLGKRYRRLAKHTQKLHNTFDEETEEPLMSTMDPSRFTCDDVKSMYAYLRERGLSPNGIDREISALSMLCKYHLNDAVSVFKVKYPVVSKKSRHDFVSVYSREQYVKVLECALNVSQTEKPHTDRWYYKIRAYAIVSLSLYAGLRCEEVRYAKLKNLDLENGTIFLEDVKGKGTYGSKRMTPIRPECIPVLSEYLCAREWFGVDSEYMFANEDHEVLCETSPLRITQVWVDREVGFHITFQECRRAYAQYAVDDGATTDLMQNSLGHASPATTFGFYAKLRQHRAVKDLSKIFRNSNIGGTNTC